MKLFILAAAVLFAHAAAFAQKPINELVAAEHAFASAAAEKGVKTAFLEFAAPDAVLFLPDRVNAKEYWSASAEFPGLLAWAPNFADISSNGILGYTTGNWESRRTKDQEPNAFGEFVTVWLRQPNGNFRYVADIGVWHQKPGSFSKDWTSPPDSGTKADTNGGSGSSAIHSANRYYEMIDGGNFRKAYDAYLSENVRGYREGKMPILGRKALAAEVASLKKLSFARKSVFFGTADLAYTMNTYSSTDDQGRSENGNFLQIWKFTDGKWQIVLDIFKPIPAGTKKG